MNVYVTVVREEEDNTEYSDSRDRDDSNVRNSLVRNTYDRLLGYRSVYDTRVSCRERRITRNCAFSLFHVTGEVYREFDNDIAN